MSQCEYPKRPATFATSGCARTRRFRRNIRPDRCSSPRIAAGPASRDLHEADPHHVKMIGPISLAEYDLARVEPDQFDALLKEFQHGGERGRGEIREQRHFPQVSVERALAIEPIEHRLRRLIALQHVQHVAEDFQHLAIVARRGDRRRPRIVIHASHLAENHIFPRKLGRPTAMLINERHMRIATGRIDLAIARRGGSGCGRGSRAGKPARDAAGRLHGSAPLSRR